MLLKVLILNDSVISSVDAADRVHLFKNFLLGTQRVCTPSRLLGSFTSPTRRSSQNKSKQETKAGKWLQGNMTYADSLICTEGLVPDGRWAWRLITKKNMKKKKNHSSQNNGGKLE